MTSSILRIWVPRLINSAINRIRRVINSGVHVCAPGTPYESCSAWSYATATILRSKKRADELVSSFNRSWKRFSGTWKKARADASEKSVHDLRVNTRRIIATLELARVLSNRGDIAKVQRSFKKVLQRRGRMRDVQVEIDIVPE